jgi:hypothetical protein
MKGEAGLKSVLEGLDPTPPPPPPPAFTPPPPPEDEVGLRDVILEEAFSFSLTCDFHVRFEASQTQTLFLSLGQHLRLKRWESQKLLALTNEVNK